MVSVHVPNLGMHYIEAKTCYINQFGIIKLRSSKLWYLLNQIFLGIIHGLGYNKLLTCMGALVHVRRNHFTKGFEPWQGL